MGAFPRVREPAAAVQAPGTLGAATHCCAVGAEVKKQGLKKVALLGTAYTMEEGFYRDRLEQKYGCVPESFEPINDGGGPLTVQALLDGDVDVADIFTTTPEIADNDLVVLEDPENNFIAQQVLPLAAADRLPQEAVDALNELSGKLTTEALIDLNRQVSGEDQVSPADAAQEWLSANGY